MDGLTGHHADATWWHVITQTSGFDYPYGEFPAFKPGEPVTLGKLELTAGCHVLRFQAVGHHPESKGCLMRIDHVIVE